MIKYLTPICRADGVKHDELVAHWRSPHAPGVRAHLKPDRYSVTFFDPRDGRAPYDGMAALTYDDAQMGESLTGANTPSEVATDGFVDLVTTPLQRTIVQEHVIVAGPGEGPATAEERESAFKMTFLVSLLEGEDIADVHRHWLELHAPNVRLNFVESGGVRYVINLADETLGSQPFVGIAELWYRDQPAAKSHRVADDGFNAKTTGISLPGKESIIVMG